jgi:hypothetical protein
MAWGKRDGGDGCLGRLALVLALLALALAWMAYKRTGGSLDTLLKSPWGDIGGVISPGEEEKAAGDEDRGFDLIAEARARLEKHRGEVEAVRNLEEVRADVEEIREDLRRTYEGASASTRERWTQVDRDLERLERQVRNGSQQAAETLDATVERLKRWRGDER